MDAMPEQAPNLRPLESEGSPRMQAPLDPHAVACLNELVREFGSSLELEEVMRNVAIGLKRSVAYDTFAVLLLDDLGQQLRFRFAEGYPDDVLANWSFGLGQGIVGTVAQTRQVLRVDDVAAEARYIAAAPGLRSELAIPLLVKGRTIGVLDVGSRSPGHFTASHQQLLCLVADHLAVGIENARLYESVRDQARTLALLHETSRELTSILDREKLLHKVARLVKRLIDYQVFSVMLWNEESQLLEHTFSLRYDERIVQKGGFVLGHGVTGTAAALRQPIRVPNVHLNPLYAECGQGIEVRSELAVPLVFKDRLIGVLDLESTEYNAFSPHHEQILGTLASYIAVALENARLYAQVTASETRLARDLDTARDIQTGLLPESRPQVEGLDVGVAYDTARHLGGDFFDFLPYSEGRFAVAVGDAAGKGTAAALHGSLAVGLLRGHVVEHPCPPGEMLAEMNRHLNERRIDNRFVAMIFGIYDPRDRSLLLANAGIPRPLLVREGRVEEVDVEGTPLGLLHGVDYDERRVALSAGDLLVLISDGLTESGGRYADELAERRMRDRLLALGALPAQQIADEMLRSTGPCASDGADCDDRTVVVLKLV
jgi:sigma-B regulation protein RsbU (phosphoserine phosphatase)